MEDRRAALLGIASRLRRAREEAGLTQDEAAALLDLHRVSVTNIENGRRNCYAHELRRLCVAYRVSADWVLGFGDKHD